jgi:hypothetical protein
MGVRRTGGGKNVKCENSHRGAAGSQATIHVLQHLPSSRVTPLYAIYEQRRGEHHIKEGVVFHTLSSHAAWSVIILQHAVHIYSLLCGTFHILRERIIRLRIMNLPGFACYDWLFIPAKDDTITD